MISVLIMTWNEEANLQACLDSVSWSDDIVVLDSFSTDRTVEIATAAGARVIQRVYDSEDQQRMFGLTQIPFEHDWVYTPDADEVTPLALRDEMLAIARVETTTEVMFKARYKNMFMGKWIRHSSLYPTWITRLVRHKHVRFERKVHSVCVPDGPIGHLQQHFIHYSFNKGMAAWYEKHNRYSTVEATLAGERSKTAVSIRDIFSLHSDVRRRGLKSLSYKVPFRPSLRFLYMYVLRGGFLDGWAGYAYCRLISGYEFMILLKTAEIERRQRGLNV